MPRDYSSINQTHFRTCLRAYAQVGESASASSFALAVTFDIIKIMKEKFVRKLQRSGTHSYSLNIPKELVEEFGWRDRQKLEIVFGGRKHDLTIRDWKK